MNLAHTLLSWLVLLAVAVANGALRQFAYPSTLGDFAARQVATGVGAVLLGVAMWVLLAVWPTGSAREAWRTGGTWATLTVAFEAGLALAGGRGWGEVLSQYALWRGSLWPLLILWIGVAPAAFHALRTSRVAVGPTLAWGIVTWLACGAVFGVARAGSGVGTALVVHLVAAPLLGAAATVGLYRDPAHPGPIWTAATFAGLAAFLDAVVVAPFLERSYAMFSSAIGTWIPLLLIFVGSTVTARRLSAGR